MWNFDHAPSIKLQTIDFFVYHSETSFKTIIAKKISNSIVYNPSIRTGKYLATASDRTATFTVQNAQLSDSIYYGIKLKTEDGFAIEKTVLVKVIGGLKCRKKC